MQSQITPIIPILLTIQACETNGSKYMGLIVLIMMGAYIFVISLIVFMYGFAIYAIWKNVKPKLRPIPVIAVSIIASLLLYIVYNNFYKSDSMLFARSFFGLAPVKSHVIETKTETGRLIFTIKLDFNTGARGGANIDNSLVYIHGGKHKEIIMTQNPINMKHTYYKHALRIDKIADETQKHRGYGNYYYDLYLSPYLFTHKEYDEIRSFMKKNHEKLSHKINEYLNNQETETYHKIKFRNMYYQDVKSLSKTYVCANNLKLYLTANGRLYYNVKSKISTSLIDIGQITNNGHTLLLKKYIKLTKKNDKFQIYQGETLIKECFDSNGTNLFEEFKLKQNNKYYN